MTNDAYDDNISIIRLLKASEGGGLRFLGELKKVRAILIETIDELLPKMDIRSLAELEELRQTLGKKLRSAQEKRMKSFKFDPRKYPTLNFGSDVNRLEKKISDVERCRLALDLALAIEKRIQQIDPTSSSLLLV